MSSLANIIRSDSKLGLISVQKLDFELHPDLNLNAWLSLIEKSPSDWSGLFTNI